MKKSLFWTFTNSQWAFFQEMMGKNLFLKKNSERGTSQLFFKQKINKIEIFCEEIFLFENWWKPSFLGIYSVLHLKNWFFPFFTKIRNEILRLLLSIFYWFFFWKKAEIFYFNLKKKSIKNNQYWPQNLIANSCKNWKNPCFGLAQIRNDLLLTKWWVKFYFWKTILKEECFYFFLKQKSIKLKFSMRRYIYLKFDKNRHFWVF